MSCQISGNKELCVPLAMDGISIEPRSHVLGPSVQTLAAEMQEAVGKILYTNPYDRQELYRYLHPVLIAILAIRKSLLSH